VAQAQLASLQRRRGDYAPAMDAARAGLADSTALGDDALRLAFLHVIAQTHWSLAEYRDAIASYHQVIELARARGDFGYLAQAEAGIGIVHAEHKEWNLARPHYERALAAVRAMPQP